jgi:sec-independent protein translocase protein TatB
LPSVGLSELALLFVIGLLILGPERLPRVASQLGRWVGRARRTANQLRYQLEREVTLSEQDRVRKPEPPRPAAKPVTTPPAAPAAATAPAAAAAPAAASTPAAPAVPEAATSDDQSAAPSPVAPATDPVGNETIRKS